MLERFEIRTSSRNEFIDITSKVRGIVANSEIIDGIAIIFTPHTTAGITINENADPDVQTDMIKFMEKLVPKSGQGFRHYEGNSDSHIKSSLFSPSLTVIVANGEIILGRWQGIYFCEFDGARSRTCYVKVIKG
jgi:secondary thiamine-phosphate synthase enzyme